MVDIQAKGKEMASRCFAEDEEFLAKEKIAEWLGGQYVYFEPTIKGLR